MKNELEINIKILELQIKNLKRLVKQTDNPLLKKILIAKRRNLHNVLIRYRNLILKEKRKRDMKNRFINFTNFIELSKVKKILPK